MHQNHNIINKIKAMRKVMLGIILFYAFFWLILNAFLTIFMRELSLTKNQSNTVKAVAFGFLMAVFVISMFVFWLKKIYRLKALVNAKALVGIVEDFVIISYIRDGRKCFKVYPVVREMESNKLYFTYDDYSLSYYNTKYRCLNNTLVNMEIYRKDGSVVSIGDMVHLYIRNYIPVRVTTGSDNEVRLNNKKVIYTHINKDFSNSIFNEFVFFEGVIEVENVNGFIV